MRKVIYLFAVVVLAVGFVSCNDDDHDYKTDDQNIELRAKTLGYTDAVTYKQSVATQCEAGNHENCDIQNDGSHNVCAYAEHSGMKHDGTDHKGNAHGTHDKKGHSHNSHGKGNHN